VYFAAFFGMLLTAFGSAYYHLSPDNNRLVWDRIPMTIVFMSLVAVMIAERINLSLGFWLWPPLLIVGIASVVQWHLSETRGAGDLRFYGAVQAYAVLVFLVILFFPTHYTHGRYLAGVVGFYILAKLLETFDRQIFDVGEIMSGHTLKHIAAAFGGYCILRMLQERRIEKGAVRERLAA
jgi:ABC-type maltose transport system permease subunit